MHKPKENPSRPKARIVVQSLRFPETAQGLGALSSESLFSDWLRIGIDQYSQPQLFPHEENIARVLVLPGGLHIPVILAQPDYRHLLVEVGPNCKRHINVEASFQKIWNWRKGRAARKKFGQSWTQTDFNYLEFVSAHNEVIRTWLLNGTYRIARALQASVIFGADMLTRSGNLVPQVVCNPPQIPLVHQLIFQAQSLTGNSALGYKASSGRTGWDFTGIAKGVRGTGFHACDIKAVLDGTSSNGERYAPLYSEGPGDDSGISLIAHCSAGSSSEILPHLWWQKIFELPGGPDVIAAASLYGEPFDEHWIGTLSVKGGPAYVPKRKEGHAIASLLI